MCAVHSHFMSYLGLVVSLKRVDEYVTGTGNAVIRRPVVRAFCITTTMIMGYSTHCGERALEV